MCQINESSCGYSSKAFVIEYESESFSEGGLSGLDSSTARVGSKRGNHVSGVVRSIGLFIDGLKHCYGSSSLVAHDVGATCSIVG